MSSRSRRTLRRTKKSSFQNSPLVVRSSASRTSKSSAAFESESINTSLSSVFTDNEDIETKKKTTRRKKVRNTEDLRSRLIESQSTDSTSDLETLSEKGAANRGLSQIITTATRSKKKSRKSVFTLPDISISSSKSGDVEEAVDIKKATRKRKIRHTQDLNAIENDKRDSDIIVKAKSKKTKKARLPSFLPQIDVFDDTKKYVSVGASSTNDSDNKENDTNTESTDTEKRKSRKGRSRRAKKKLAQNELMAKIISENRNDAITNAVASTLKDITFKGDAFDSKNNNHAKKSSIENSHTLTPRKNISKKSGYSKDEDNSSVSQKDIKENTRNDEQITQEDVAKNDNAKSKELSRRGSFMIVADIENKSNEKSRGVSSLDKRKSKRNTDIISFCKSNDSPNKNGTTNHFQRESKSLGIQLSEDLKETSKKLSTSNIKPKRSTFDRSSSKVFNSPNKSGNTNNFENESDNVGPKVPQEQNQENAVENSLRKPLKRDTFDIVSNTEETCGNLEISQETKERRSQKRRTSSSTIESVTKLGILNRVSGLNTDDVSTLRKPVRSSSTINKHSTFERKSSLSVLNQNESATTRKSIRVSKDSTFELKSRTPKLNRENTFEIPEKSINLFSQDVNEISGLKEMSSNESYDVVRNSKRTRSSNRVSKTHIKDSMIELNGSKLNKENTFEIHSEMPTNLFEQDINEITSLKDMSSNETYDMVPTSKRTRSSNRLAFDKNPNGSIVTIDLTDSIVEQIEPSPSDYKETTEKRKSSFDVSFNVKMNRKSEKLLDCLNVTRRDSRKSSFKKSSSLTKYSTGSEEEDAKLRRNFVTLRRGCHTMIDFDTGESSDDVAGGISGKGDLKQLKIRGNLNHNGSGDKSVLIDDKISPDATKHSVSFNVNTSKKPAPKRSILKKSVRASTRSRRDTFEIAECFYESIESLKKTEYQEKPVLQKTEVTPNITLQSGDKRDIFNLVSNTPIAELGNMMIGSGESVILGPSFLQDETNVSVMPRLTRTSTFTKNEEALKTPQLRKSTRKRWSQVERTPIFNKLPVGSPASKAGQPTEVNLQNSINKSQSINVISPPDFTAINQSNSLLKTTTREPKTAEKGKKSVKIETPLQTPKIRLHSPLVMRKTPKPDFSATDNSILASNCAYKKSPRKLSPPSCTSTPYHKKKEVSLLQKVLTNEKNKSEKIIGKSSVRTKMPNFAKIHQRQFEKMENLKEMQERKAIRAQFLLSGTKPSANVSSPGVVEKESRKKLKFSPVKENLPAIASGSAVTRKSGGKNSKPVSKPLQHMLRKRASLEKQKKEVKSKVPVLTKPTVVPMRGAKETKNPEQKGFTRFGFKLPVGKENVTKAEQIKAVTTKSKVAVNRTEKNRNQLGGVRSNRRFELLMKMRQNQK